MAKNTCEGALGLNVNNLRRGGFIQKGLSHSGNITWSYGDDEPYASASIRGYDGRTIELHYQSSGQSVTQTISIEWTRCRFGGERPWFTCPSCYQRYGKLYAAGTYFYCRKCYGLCYETQLENPRRRANFRAHKLEARINGGTKPKWMRWKTFYRLWHEAQAADMRCMGYLASFFGM
jgi:hypothetical protein